MKKFAIIIGIFILALGFNEARAQVGEFAYQVSFPTGDFKNLVSKTSFVGFSGQYRKLLHNKQLSVGGSLNWFYFVDKKGVQTNDFGEQGTYHGNVTGFTNIYSLLAVVQYDFKDYTKEKFVPFIRGGAGVGYQDQRTDIGLYEFRNDGAQFAWNAELGVRGGKGGRAVLLALTYHGLPKSGDMVATSFWGVKLGITRFKF